MNQPYEKFIKLTNNELTQPTMNQPKQQWTKQTNNESTLNNNEPNWPTMNQPNQQWTQLTKYELTQSTKEPKNRWIYFLVLSWCSSLYMISLSVEQLEVTRLP